MRGRIKQALQRGDPRHLSSGHCRSSGRGGEGGAWSEGETNDSNSGLSS